MNLLSGNNLKKTFSGETLFENVSFNVYSSDKIGFIGVNGAGKSTLFKMLAENMDYDAGEIARSREAKISYLDQYAFTDGSRSIMDEMLTAFSEVIETEKQLDDIHLALELSRGDTDALISRQAALQERFLKLDGMLYRSRIKSALTGLGFSEEEFSMPLSRLSGGQMTRIALCKILLSDANLLLLDEPTNHLDIDSVEWLEDFLIEYKGAFIVISHDRYFLDRVTDKTFELENGHFRAYDGNYTAYMAQREIEKLTEQRKFEGAVSEIARLEEVIEQQRRWKHKKNKKTHTLDNTRKAIERIEKTLVVPQKAPETMRFRFKACEGGGKIVLTAEDLGIQFGEKKLFEHVNLLLKKGEKVFLLGPNGCGKTTLIKIIMDICQPDFGEYKIGADIRVGYYDQLKENLSRDKTVIDEIWDEYPDLTQTEVRNALAVFLFKGDDVFKEIRSLSGGELARVELTKLMLKKVNFLVMDEPTNHLDIASREALEQALSEYDGTMLVVSHDRYFINKLADRIWYLTPNGIQKYEGNYDEYIAGRTNEVNAITADVKSEDRSSDYKESKRAEALKRKTLNRISKVEELIEETDKEIALLSQQLEDPQFSSDYVKLNEITGQIDSLRQKLDEYMEEWEALQQAIPYFAKMLTSISGNTERFSKSS